MQLKRCYEIWWMDERRNKRKLLERKTGVGLPQPHNQTRKPTVSINTHKMRNRNINVIMDGMEWSKQTTFLQFSPLHSSKMWTTRTQLNKKHDINSTPPAYLRQKNSKSVNTESLLNDQEANVKAKLWKTSQRSTEDLKLRFQIPSISGTQCETKQKCFLPVPHFFALTILAVHFKIKIISKNECLKK